MTNNDIEFKVDFYQSNSPADITFTDVVGDASGYGALGLTQVDVEGLIKIVGPTSTVYINAGYVLEDFSAPDLSTGAWDKSAIALPLDSDSEIVEGVYTFSYKVSDDGGSNVYEYSKSFTYSPTAPDIDITVSHSCRTSEYVSTDATSYALINNSTTFDPSTTTRSHTITKPVGSGVTTPGTTTDIARTIGGGSLPTTRLWTGAWQSDISTIVGYNIELWETAGNNWITFTYTLTGYEAHTVVCDDCVCCIRQCIVNLNTKLATYSGSNGARYNAIKSILDAVERNWMLWQMAEICGVDSDAYCQNIKELAVADDCDCADTTDTSPEEVVPWGASAGGTSTSGTIWLSGPGSGVPAAAAGNSGYYYLVTTTSGSWTLGDILLSDGSTWTLLMNIVGADGSTPDSVLYNSVSDNGTPAGTGETDLKSYTLLANTVDTNGQYISIQATFELGINHNTKLMKLYWGGDIILSYITSSLLTTVNNRFEFRAHIYRTGSATQNIKTFITRKGLPGYIIGPEWSAKTKDFTGANIIKVTGTNGAAILDDIICDELTVENHTKS